MDLDVSSAPAPRVPPGPRDEALPFAPQPVVVFQRRPLVGRGALCLALACCLFGYVLTHWVLWPVTIDGESMTPNYDDGQPAIINRLAYLADRPRRGDVVGLRVGQEFYLKRIIGLPGEHIEFLQDKVVVNGRPLLEPYPVKPLLWRLAPVQLGANDYFVMGDNRSQSKLGPISRDRIIGKSIY